MILTGAAVATTGLAVGTGLVGPDRHSDPTASAASAPSSPSSALSASSAPAAAVILDSTRPQARRVAPGRVEDRTARVSRSDLRTSVDEVKKAALDQDEGGQVTRTEDLTSRDPRTIARAMLPDFGFGSDQFSCLDSIYVNESGWNVHADNPTSSAYGIPQTLPGSKMASAGADWVDNPVTQIRWGLGYIKARYGTPCSAWGFKQGHGWY